MSYFDRLLERMDKEYANHLSGKQFCSDSDPYSENIQLVWDMQSYKVDALVKGPKGSPYEGGIFRFEITLP